jgi:predicted dinucleotide-binding enzyme
VGSLDGKVLLDVTNPILPDMSALEFGSADSGAEYISRLAPGAKVVKAYNYVFAQVLAADDRDFGPVKPAGFYCGDDPEAKTKVAELILDSGFEPIDAGPLVRARDLEAATMFIIRLGYAQGLGPNIAWAVLRR